MPKTLKIFDSKSWISLDFIWIPKRVYWILGQVEPLDGGRSSTYTILLSSRLPLFLWVLGCTNT